MMLQWRKEVRAGALIYNFFVFKTKSCLWKICATCSVVPQSSLLSSMNRSPGKFSQIISLTLLLNLDSLVKMKVLQDRPFSSSCAPSNSEASVIACRLTVSMRTSASNPRESLINVPMVLSVMSTPLELVNGFSEWKICFLKAKLLFKRRFETTSPLLTSYLVTKRALISSTFNIS